MSESLEYKTLLACYDKLVTALKSDPLGIATELIAVDLIPPLDVKKTDAQELARLLLNKVELVPERYHDIVEAFSRHRWLKDIVTILQTEHSKVENDSVEVYSPTGDACTESMSKLSISSGAESPKPSAEGEALSDDSFKLELDCPHKQSSLPIPNPVVRFEDLSKSDRKDLFAQMNELTKEICMEYSKLCDKVYVSLRERFEHDHVVLTLTRDHGQLFQGNKKLLRAKNMLDVFKVIQSHCSYFNYNLLESLVQVHGTSEDKKCLDGYLKSFASYCQAMPCAEEICGSDGSGTDRIKLKFKLEYDRQQLKPNYIKDNIIRNIARILKIKPSSLYLHRIREGCVCLEFLIPSCLFDGLFPLSDDQKVALYREVHVTSIQCDQPSLHVDIGEVLTELDESQAIKAKSLSDSPLRARGYSDPHSAVKPKYLLMKPPKDKYLHPQDRSQSVAVGGRLLQTHQPLHERRAASVAVGYHQQPARSKDIGSTTSSQASSGYFSSGSSMGYGDGVMEDPEGFDYESFTKPWMEVRKRGPKWKQLREELLHHADIGEVLTELEESHTIKVKSLSDPPLRARGYSDPHSAVKPTYPLMKPPKEFIHFPSKYLHPQDRSQSVAVGGHLLQTHQPLHERRAASVAVGYHQQPARSKDIGSTTSSQASSGYFSSGSSMGYGDGVMEDPEGFDYKSFPKQLTVGQRVPWMTLRVTKRDPEWQQFDEEWWHHNSEWHRLNEEVKQLGREKDEAKDKQDIELKLKIKELERELAESKRLKACYQQRQRAHELEREELLQDLELKTATNDDMKSEIQRRLEEAERKIHWWKEKVSSYERQVSEHEESLSQLREGEEGHQTDTAVLKTKSFFFSPLAPPSHASPVTTLKLYTCPSCGKQYRSDKSGQCSGEERCVSCSHGQQQTKSGSIISH